MSRRKLTDEEIAANREAIRQAATRLFSAQGYASVTMRSIARELGWSPMAAYRYFDSKSAIFTAVREEALRRLGEAMLAAGRSTGDPLQSLRRQAEAYVEFGLSHRHEYALAFEYFDQQMPGFPLQTDDGLMSWRLLRQAVDRLCDTGVLEPDPLTISHLLWCSLHGIVALNNAERLMFGRQAGELTGAAVDMVLQKLLPERTGKDAHP